MDTEWIKTNSSVGTTCGFRTGQSHGHIYEVGAL